MEWKEGKHFSLWKLFYLYWNDGIWWFRFFDGYGINAKDYTKHKPLFSERNGYVKSVRFRNWYFRILVPAPTGGIVPKYPKLTLIK